MSTYTTIIVRGALQIAVNAIDDGEPIRIDTPERRVYLNDEEVQALVDTTHEPSGTIRVVVDPEDAEWVAKLLAAMLALNGVTADVRR